MNLRLAVIGILVFGVVMAFRPHRNMEAKKADPLRKIKQNAFKKGEFLRYDVSYGYFDAAEATLEIKKSSQKNNGRNTMHIVGKGKSRGALSFFFRVDDRYETYIDEEALLPWEFIRHVREGSYELDRNIKFNHYTNKATVEQNDKRHYPVEPNTQDLLSAFYYARTLDLQNAKPNEEFMVNTFFDREMYQLKFKFLGKDKLKTKLGTFDCLKFRPLVEVGRVFKEEEDVTIWISNDVNKVPIRVQSDLLVGSIVMELVEHKNLAAPLKNVNE